MFEAIEAGWIKAIWIVATNPAASLPRSDRVRAALAACRSSSCPTAGRPSRPNTPTSCCPPPPGARRTAPSPTPNGGFPASARSAPAGSGAPGLVAVRRGRAPEAGPTPSPIAPGRLFREHAALSAYENDGRGRSTSRRSRRWTTPNMTPCRRPLAAPGRRAGGRSVLPPGGFFRRDGRARFVAVVSGRAARTGTFGLVLNTGRVRDQWHTMTRTGLSPGLARHREAPFVEVHPDDAARLGPQRRRLPALHHGARRGGLRVVATSEPASRILVRADPLDRRHRRPRPRRRADPCVGRSGLRSAKPDSKATAATITPSPIAAEGFLVARPPSRAARLARARADRGCRRRSGHLRFGRAPGGAAGVPCPTGSAAPLRPAGAPTRAGKLPVGDLRRWSA